MTYRIDTLTEANSRTLPFPVPGQEAGARFGVVFDGVPLPEGGLGYVVSLGVSGARILGCMSVDGAVWRCAEPLAALPGTAPDVEVRIDSDLLGGRVLAKQADDDLLLVGACLVHPKRHSASEYEFAYMVADMGDYYYDRWDSRTFLAVAFLVFSYLPRTSTHAAGYVAGCMSDVLAKLRDEPLPDAIDKLLFDVQVAELTEDDSCVSGYVRYASRLFDAMGADHLREVVESFNVDVRWLSSTGQLWLGFDDTFMSGEDRDCLLTCESIVNRLIMIDLHLRRLDGGWGLLAHFDESQVALADEWACSSYLGFLAGLAAANKVPDNPLLHLDGAHARTGGEWDMRTRLAFACEYAHLPFRLIYRMDCSANDRAAAFSVALPPECAMPSWRWNAVSDGWMDMGGARRAAAETYGLRLAILMCAAAFSLTAVDRVTVDLHAHAVDGAFLGRVTVGRGAWEERLSEIVHQGMVPVDDAWAKPATLAARLSFAREIPAFDGEGMLAGGSAPAPLLMRAHTPLAGDARPLPPALARLLHADVVGDLDVMTPDDADALECEQRIMATAQDSPLLACASLEEQVSQWEDSHPDDGRAPLYCASQVARCLIDAYEPDTTARYRRLPDAIFQACTDLTRLYHGMHDNERALAMARKCVALAPSSPTGYLLLAQVQLDAGRVEEALRTLSEGLPTAFGPESAAQFYAHLAFAFRSLGRIDEALACYVVFPAATGNPAPADELARVLETLGADAAPSFGQALRTLVAAGVPADAKKTRALIARCTLGLVDAGFFEAAYAPACALATFWRSDVLIATAKSLHRA